MVKTGRVSVGPPIHDLAKRHDALVVLDIDEVVLEFIAPFSKLLEENGARLHPESFKLTGNVRSVATGAALSGNALDAMTTRLYEEQEARQMPVAGAAAALQRIEQIADPVFLTAMTPAYYPMRRRLLDREGLRYPMIATERGKGGVVAELAKRWSGPIVFVDDLPPNLALVRKSVPRVHLIHLMANTFFRRHLPELPHGASPARDWSEAVNRIEALVPAG